MFRVVRMQARKKPVVKKDQGRNFSKSIHAVDSLVPLVSTDEAGVLYRGIRRDPFFASSPIPLFKAEVIFFGLASYVTSFDPRKVTIDNYMIARHKRSPLFLSLSQERRVSSSIFSKSGPLLTLDVSNLPGLLMVDAEEAYYKALGARYCDAKEKELTVFALLYASITSFQFVSQQQRAFLNPFYLPINPAETENCLLLQALYDAMCHVHHFALLPMPNDEYHQAKINYMQLLVSLYEKVLGDKNPFNMPIHVFRETFPEYAACFFHEYNGNYRERFFAINTQDQHQKMTVFSFLCEQMTLQRYCQTVDAGSYRLANQETAIQRIEDDADLSKAFGLSS